MLSALVLSVSLLTPIEKLAATVKTPVSDRVALRAELIALPWAPDSHEAPSRVLFTPRMEVRERGHTSNALRYAAWRY